MAFVLWIGGQTKEIGQSRIEIEQLHRHVGLAPPSISGPAMINGTREDSCQSDCFAKRPFSPM